MTRIDVAKKLLVNTLQKQKACRSTVLESENQFYILHWALCLSLEEAEHSSRSYDALDMKPFKIPGTQYPKHTTTPKP